MKNMIVGVFDVMFIMLLCFASLLVPILVRGKVLVGSGSGGGLTYTFSWPTFLLTLLIIGGYILFILSQSDKELRHMIKKLYDKNNSNNRQLGVDVNASNRSQESSVSS